MKSKNERNIEIITVTVILLALYYVLSHIVSFNF